MKWFLIKQGLWFLLRKIPCLFGHHSHFESPEDSSFVACGYCGRQEVKNEM